MTSGMGTMWLVRLPFSRTWWCGGSCSTSVAADAVSFNTRDDAEKAIASSQYLTRIRAFPSAEVL